jgi:hypothetical protein
MRLIYPMLLALTACAEFPALDVVVPASKANGASPALVPLAPLLARADASDKGAAAVQSALEPRLTGLHARAARLRGPVIPAPVRARMLRGIR